MASFPPMVYNHGEIIEKERWCVSLVLRIVGVVLVGLAFFSKPPTLIARAEENPVVINMTASIVKKTPDGKLTGGWDPKRIVVKQGQTVVLRIKSLDSAHVFYLSGYEIASNEINPGSPVEVRFAADKAGQFYYMCHMECGPLHQKMVGMLVVEAKN